VRVQNHAARSPTGTIVQPAVEERAIATQSLHTHEDGIAPGANAMRVTARDVACDLHTRAIPGRDTAIGRERHLERHEGASASLPRHENVVQLCRLAFAATHVDAHPLLPQERDAATRHTRIRIEHRGHHALDRRRQDGVHAGWRPARVTAWLQVDVQRQRTLPLHGLGVRGSERQRLCVRLASGAVETFSDNPTILRQHSPDHGVRRGHTVGARSELEGPPHELVVHCQAGHAPNTSGDSSVRLESTLRREP
jgi:hypothetical protein